MMLSRVLRLDLVDGRGARLHDLVVDPRAGDYPPVTHLLVRHGPNDLRLIPWDSVQRLNTGTGRMILAPGAVTAAPANGLDEATLLRRDVLDAVIIDLEARRTLLANDLWLDERDGRLHLAAVDASPWGIVRRLTRGLIDRDVTDDLYDWRYVEFLRGQPHAPGTGTQQRVARLPPGEIAHLVESMPYLHAAELVGLLPEELGADVLEAMSPERQLQVFEELSEEQGSQLLALMAPDAAADLVGHLQPETARRRLETLPPTRRDQIAELLRYPEDSAGGIMTNDIVLVPSGVTVAQARGLLRDRVATPDLVYYAYVVDDDAQRHLRGVVTLRTILTAGDDQILDQVMDPYLITIHPLEPAIAAAQRVVDNQLIALPVTNHTGQLVGAVTVDAAVAQVAPTGWRAHAPKVFS